MKNKYIREPGNFYTHLFPAILTIPGLFLLLGKADSVFELAAAVVYGLGMLLLFSISATYHSIPRTPKQLRFWQKFDHCSIYIMIAGSFTPTCVIVFKNRLGWILLAMIWLFAIIGILLKVFNRLKKQRISTALYILMGCMIIPFVIQMAEKLPLTALAWLFLGGVFYIGGTYYYAKDKALSRFIHSHEVWHIFVNLGALAHFIYNYGYVF